MKDGEEKGRTGASKPVSPVKPTPTPHFTSVRLIFHLFCLCNKHIFSQIYYFFLTSRRCGHCGSRSQFPNKKEKKKTSVSEFRGSLSFDRNILRKKKRKKNMHTYSPPLCNRCKCV
uniref:Uncharacterized protein n=1 Tax=Trypanosoma congolense (strain IL3000) TaxID=1068625 RepID=G0UMV9_TRYCI|nr:hypothetical protein, unlikely [Trypanosoma congolense IL3000]